MISIIKDNIKTAWKTKRTFIVLLILVQMFSAFSILFVMGAISNDYMSLKENADSNTYIWIYINDVDKDPVYYKDIEKMFFEIDERFNNIYSGIGVSFPYIYDENSCVTVFCKFSIKNGKYVTNSILEGEQLRLVSGEIFSESTLNSGKNYATISNYDGMYKENNYIYSDTEIEIIGVEKNPTEGFINLVFNPATARSINVSATSIVLELSRILSQEEYKEFISIINKYMGGKYSSDLETYSNEDSRAILRSTFSMSVITAIATIVVLVIIYNYFFTLRKKNYAIMQMVGCTRIKGAMILLIEMMLFSIPSIIVGTMLFSFCQKRWFDSIFRYMEITITTDVCVGLAIYEIAAILVVFFVLSIWYSRMSVKSQLIMLQE